MKKAFGVLLFASGGIFLLIFIISITLVSLENRFENEPISTILFLSGFVSIISGLLMFFGWKLIQSSNYQSNLLKQVDDVEIKDLNIDNYLSVNDFIKLNFLQIYSKPIFLFITLMGLINLFALIWAFFNNAENQDFSWYAVMLPIAFLILIPLSIYFQSKKVYNSNKFLNNTLHFHFSENQLHIQGNSLNSSFCY